MTSQILLYFETNRDPPQTTFGLHDVIALMKHTILISRNVVRISENIYKQLTPYNYAQFYVFEAYARWYFWKYFDLRSFQPLQLRGSRLFIIRTDA